MATGPSAKPFFFGFVRFSPVLSQYCPGIDSPPLVLFGIDTAIEVGDLPGPYVSQNEKGAHVEYKTK